MNEDLNDDLPQVDELTTLKARADQMGVSYHPSIGVEKLREKIAAALASDGPVVDDEVEDETPTPAPAVNKPVEETIQQKRARLKREAEKLVRIRVTCMNPAKREWEGEIFTAGNSLVGTHKKYVPFNTDDGWHVPHIIYKQIVNRKCQIFVSRKTKEGRVEREGKLINEFAVEVLPQLTEKELKELSRRQAMARSVD
jgi:hypothetical protein